MIDGINTGMLPVDVFHHAYTLGVDITPQSVYVNTNGMIHGFSDRVDTDTGEIRKICTLRGSLHKYANAGIHNADSFRMSDLCRVFAQLQELYSINPDIVRLNSVEFGVNIKLPYDPCRILKAIRMYKGKVFVPMNNLGFIYESNLYKIKIYDKGRQCHIPGFKNVLRIEIKATNSYLKRNHIYVPMLGDLLNIEVWEKFEALLLEIMEDIVIVEATPMEGLTPKERALFTLFIGDGWQGLNRNVLHKRKKQFTELAKRIGASCIKEEIRGLVIEECQKLRNISYTMGDKINVFANLQKVVKVNEGNKPSKTGTIEEATKSTFLEQKEKRYFGDKINTWIRGDFVAYITQDPPPPNSLNKPPNMDAKLSYTARSEIKSRGKPPDIEEFNTG